MRLYLQNVAPGYTPTTKRGGWTTSTSTSIKQLGTVKSGTKTFSGQANAAGASVLQTRYVSTPFLQGGLIPSGATLSWMASISAASGVYTPKIYAYITTGDTDTPRGTLITPQATAGANTSTTETGRGQATMALADGITVSVGDRLVIEAGFLYVSGTAGSPRTYFGGTTSDLTEGSTNTVQTGWVDLSSDLDFLFTPPAPASPAVAEYYTVEGWDTTTQAKTIANVVAAANDLLVLFAMSEENVAFGAPTATGLTWTNQFDTGAANSGEAAMWTAPAAGAVGPVTLNQSRTNALNKWGNGIIRVANGSVGAKASNSFATSTVGGIDITTTQDNSSVLVIIENWTASDSSSRTWSTVNSFTPTAANGGERLYFRNAVDYAVFCAWYPNVGTAGLKTVGLTTLPSGSRIIGALEIKQPGAGGPAPFEGWGIPI